MYSIKMDPSKTAKAQVSGAAISKKDSAMIGKWIKNRQIDSALLLLNEVVAKKRAVPFPKYNNSLGHKKTTPAAGKYPVNASKKVIELLESAKSNAENKGLNLKKMYVKNVNANKGFQFFDFVTTTARE